MASCIYLFMCFFVHMCVIGFLNFSAHSTFISVFILRGDDD